MKQITNEQLEMLKQYLLRATPGVSMNESVALWNMIQGLPDVKTEETPS